MYHLKRNFLITLLIFLVNPLFANVGSASLDEEASREILENLIVLEEAGINLQNHALTKWFQAAGLTEFTETILHYPIDLDKIHDFTFQKGQTFPVLAVGGIYG